MSSVLDLARAIEQADPATVRAIDNVLDARTPPVNGRPDLSHLWGPQPGPQSMGYYSNADIMLYGGSPGGGKSDLVLGCALTQHHRSILYRKELTLCQGFVDRLEVDILRSDKGYSSRKNAWDLDVHTGFPGHKISFGGLADPGSEQKYKGLAADLVAFDETVDFTQAQVEFLSIWNRSTLPGQRCRIIMATNPPTGSSSGLWLVDYFAPWLDPEYKDPLGLGRPSPGELRWFVTLPGVARAMEHPDGVPFLVDGVPCIPRSRTFIPSKVRDNAYLAGTTYESNLYNLPEELRKPMLEGDFTQALADRPLALFPMAWIRAAVARWKELEGSSAHPRRVQPMTAFALDVARGGRDQTAGVSRYGDFFDTLAVVPGSATPDGPSSANVALERVRDGATVVVDANGPGASAYDHLNQTLGVPCRAYVGSTRSTARDRTGQYGFTNYRSQCYWKLREALDPATPEQIALPDDPGLVEELSAHGYREVSGKYQVTPKEQVIKVLGRSPDRSDVVIMAWSEPAEWIAPLSSPGRRASDSGLPPRASTSHARAPLRGPINYGPDRVI